MFKNLDRKLLRNYPLLWNTKFPYLIITGILFNVIALFGGYVFSDFSKFKEDDYGRSEFNLSVFIAIIAFLIIIGWFLFYIRNNGFKSFYPKRKNALFKEWLLIFIPFLIFVMAFFSVQLGRKEKANATYSSPEVAQQLETVFKVGFLIDNPVERQIDSTRFNSLDSTYAFKNYITYRSKIYPWQSLIARHKSEEFDKKQILFTPSKSEIYFMKMIL